MKSIEKTVRNTESTDDKKLENAIEKAIYWYKKYVLIRESYNKENNEEIKEMLLERMDMMRTHIFSSCNYLTKIYESATGRTVERVGNLESIEEISKRLERRGNIPYI